MSRKPLAVVCLVPLLSAAAVMLASPKAGPQAAARAPAGPDRPAAPPLSQAAPSKAPGLMLTFESRAPEAAGRSDVRVARMPALYVPAGTPPTPFLPAGPFRATWEGRVTATFRDEYAFSADGRGKVVVTLNGAVVLEAAGDDLSAVRGKPVQLQKGDNTLVVKYESPASGDARLRLMWTGSDSKVREPIPWLSWVGARHHDASAAPLREASRLREGRELIATLRCLKCHADATPPGPGDMPELAMDAPSLADAGRRLRPGWMAKWIADPRSLRPDASMPACVGGPDAAAKAADMAAYLATLGKPGKDEDAPDKEAATAGGRLFAHLGCVSCHTLPTRDDWAEVKDRVPLRNVSAKWRPDALREFLRNPGKHYGWIRMPDFALSELEAGDLAAFLLCNEPTAFELPAGADAARGKTLVQTAGCINCHGLDAENKSRFPALAEFPAAGWSRGCLSAEPAGRGKAPDFGLTPAQREAVVAFAATDRSALRAEALPEFAERQIRILRCIACHKRDEKQEDPWFDLAEETDPLVEAAAGMVDAEEEKHFPPEQIRPSLTWMGEKLRPEWAAAFLAGKVPYKPRPFLRSRMPAFATRAVRLAHGMALQHGMPIEAPPPPAADADKAAVGRTLAKKTGGLSCTSCHNIGKTEAVGVFEAPGVNFMHVRERLLPGYYDRWMMNPARVEPGTKMPQFWKDGKTDIGAVLGGDAARQFDALWHYLMLGHGIKAPEE